MAAPSPPAGSARSSSRPPTARRGGSGPPVSPRASRVGDLSALDGLGDTQVEPLTAWSHPVVDGLADQGVGEVIGVALLAEDAGPERFLHSVEQPRFLDVGDDVMSANRSRRPGPPRPGIRFASGLSRESRRPMTWRTPSGTPTGSSFASCRALARRAPPRMRAVSAKWRTISSTKKGSLGRTVDGVEEHRGDRRADHPADQGGSIGAREGPEQESLGEPLAGELAKTSRSGWSRLAPPCGRRRSSRTGRGWERSCARDAAAGSSVVVCQWRSSRQSSSPREDDAAASRNSATLSNSR